MKIVCVGGGRPGRWTLDDLQPSTYRVIVGAEDAARLDRQVGSRAEMAAWLARARRI